MELIPYVILWMLSSRMIYTMYIHSVEERELRFYQSTEILDNKKKQEEISWDAYHLAPLIGDMWLVLFISFYSFRLISHWLNQLSKMSEKKKERKKLESKHLQKIKELERQLQKEKEVNDNKRSEEMIAAQKEISTLLSNKV